MKWHPNNRSVLFVFMGSLGGIGRGEGRSLKRMAVPGLRGHPSVFGARHFYISLLNDDILARLAVRLKAFSLYFETPPV